MCIRDSAWTDRVSMRRSSAPPRAACRPPSVPLAWVDAWVRVGAHAEDECARRAPCCLHAHRVLARKATVGGQGARMSVQLRYVQRCDLLLTEETPSGEWSRVAMRNADAACPGHGTRVVCSRCYDFHTHTKGLMLVYDCVRRMVCVMVLIRGSASLKAVPTLQAGPLPWRKRLLSASTRGPAPAR
eukprot:141436-Prymnesium_polylepis.1